MKNNKLKKGMGVSLAAVMAASMIPACSLPAFAAEPGTTEEATVEDLASASIGGVTYFYTDTAGDNEDTVYRATVRSRKGSTEYTFSKTDLTQIADTDYYYVTVPGVTPLDGTLYGYGAGTATTYKDVYADLGVSTDESYDVISSATKYTSHHAGDIPSLVSFGTDAEGNKAITGLTLSREVKTVDADTYVDASILNAASVELTGDQAAALDITLKANPTVAPATDTIPAKLGSVEYTESKYGAKTINIYPDDTVDGYVWNEYLDSIYAATISDGTNTAGAVHWIDLYGESAATPGYHYNKVEFELNNGLVPESNPNKATVNRFADFLDAETGNLKPGTYTIKVYAEGYDTVEATITFPEEAMSSTSIGGINYFYADTAGDDENTLYHATVRSRKGSKDYYFSKADLTEVTDTDYGYVTVPGVTPLEGTLYGYGAGTATTYKDVYADLGVSTDESYDVISSATKYTSHHAGDIPSLVSFGTDAEGNKAITGLTLSREVKTVEADAYVEASILKVASAELTDAQTAALDITLKANPTVAPATDTIPATLGSIEYTESKYGAKTINIYPDDTVDGYVWNEYLDSIYAATISDGTNTVGAVHWIDLYGESAATPGYHYNKVEFELNNGLVPESNPNKATVNRFASFFDAKTGNLKPGTYTVKVYAEGYDTVEGSITLKTGWQETDGEWYYYDANYNIVTNSWAKDGKGWCWLGEDGTITKNKWIQDNGEWYFLKANGYMAANEWAKDSGGWYYMNKSGKISKNAWAKDSKGWMYLDANGRITKGKWIKSGSQWYYMKANGYMAANEWAKDSGGWMYMDASGKITKNKWVKSGGKWYYLKANGYMATGTLKIGGKTYKFDSSGRWIS